MRSVSSRLYTVETGFNRFMVGMLESPLCIGEPFEIPLELQDKEGRSTCAVGEYTAYLESE